MNTYLMACAIILCAWSGLHAQSSEEARIKAVIEQFAAAADAQDADALAGVLDPNYRVVMNQLFGSDQVMTMDRATYLDKIRKKEFGGDQRTLTFHELTLNGNTASAKVELKGQNMTFVSLLQLVKDARGHWKLVSDLPVVP